MLHHEATTARHVYTVREGSIFTRGVIDSSRPGFLVEKQPINQATGKPWQAKRTVKMFEADEVNKAMRFWLYTVTAAKKEDAPR
ncbi:hypothetical protein [Azospirillum himalayense]|uniref:Uncharacterized protein n=1 Tax=Azospirillum himalayense TaxID=654847 RepID=A0ABW0FYE0_9PROT